MMELILVRNVINFVLNVQQQETKNVLDVILEHF